MKKKFQDPELIVDNFDEDIICLSGGEGNHDSGTTGTKDPDT